MIYLKYALLSVFIASFLYRFIPLSGILEDVKNFNMESCTKAEGVIEFNNCEDAVLSNKPGVVYVSCDPIRSKYNKVLGINQLIVGESVPNGGIWKVRYGETPVEIEELVMKSETTVSHDFHPLGITTDIHPVTGKETLVVVNHPHKNAPSIEIFDVAENGLVHKRSIKHPKIYNPNSLHILRDVRFRAADGTPSFFFSNDHYFSSGILKKVENFFLYLSNVGFYNARTGQVEKGVDGLLFANGLAGNDQVLFVSETNNRSIKKYIIHIDTSNTETPRVYLDHVSYVKFNMATDNLHYVPEKNLVIVAGHPKPLDFLKYIQTKDRKSITAKPPSRIEAWDVNSGETKLLVQDDGSLFGTSTTGIVDFKTSKLIAVGLYERGILICDI